MNKRQLTRVRKICAAFPEAIEKLSHGEPTFFTPKKVFAMFANYHHDDGHVAVWVPAPPGFQDALIESAPKKYFKPPYVGGRGWIGIEIDEATDDELYAHIEQAWCLVAPKKLVASYMETTDEGS
jgi:hypothetical protein